MDEWIVGIDLGASKTALGLVDAGNDIVARRRMATRAGDGPQAVVDRITHSIHALEQMLPGGARIAAAGICTPGPVDHESGTLLDPPNIQALHNTPLGPMLCERLGVPVCVEHDAKAAALGEFHYGAGRGEKDMVYVVIGTGVGAAVILGGHLYRGRHNSAGEVGHITLDRAGDLCSCGSRGCVETFMAGPWLARHYRRALDEAGRPQPPNEVTGELVTRRAREGDPLAKGVFVQAGQALGAAIASMSMVLDVELFVIGSSIARAGELLLEPTRRAIPHHCYQSVGCRVRVETTQLWDDGPIMGCGWLARQVLERR